MSGTLFSSWEDSFGVSHVDEPIAVYENGKIYIAADGFLGTAGKGTFVGEYENGTVYRVGSGAMSYGRRTNAVAVIEGGKIYSVSKNMLGGITKSLSVGECFGGKVYSHSHKFMEGAGAAGLYSGDAEGAAAAAALVLFQLESNVSAYDSSFEEERKSYDSASFEKSEISSGGSGASAVLWIIGIAIVIALLIVALIAAAISGIAFLVVWLVAKLIRYIMKQNAESKGINPKEDDTTKSRDLIIVLIISMVISVVVTGGMNINGCGGLCSIIELIGFIWIIIAVKKGKKINLFRRKKDEIEREDVNIPSYDDKNIISDAHEIKEKKSDTESTYAEKQILSGGDKSPKNEIETDNRTDINSDNDAKETRLRSTFRTNTTTVESTESSNRLKMAEDL